MIKLSNFQFEQKERRRTYRCSVNHPKLPTSLYFSAFGESIKNCESPNGNWAAVALIYPAMVLEQDLKIHAGVNPVLLHMMRNDVQSLLQSYEPDLKRIDIIAPILTDTFVTKQNRVATGFSAGIDTFSTLKLYSESQVPEQLRITDLTVFNVGAMGAVDSSQRIFDVYCQRVESFSRANQKNGSAFHLILIVFMDSQTRVFRRHT